MLRVWSLSTKFVNAFADWPYSFKFILLTFLSIYKILSLFLFLSFHKLISSTPMLICEILVCKLMSLTDYPVMVGLIPTFNRFYNDKIEVSSIRHFSELCLYLLLFIYFIFLCVCLSVFEQCTVYLHIDLCIVFFMHSTVKHVLLIILMVKVSILNITSLPVYLNGSIKSKSYCS